MSELEKISPQALGIPDVVAAFFEVLRPMLEAFAQQKHLEISPYERAKPGDTSWVCNLYGKAWGRKVCLQVQLNAEMSVEGRTVLNAFIGPTGAVTAERPWRHHWADHIKTPDRLYVALGHAVRDLARICKGLPWTNPTSAPPVM